MPNPTAITLPIWRLVKTSDNRVTLLWTQRDEDHVLNLGPFDEACEKLAGFLAREDFGE